MPAAAGPETPLGEGGFWLDSVEMLEVVVACEEEFAMTFDAGVPIAASALTSLAHLASAIRMRVER